MPTAAAAPNAAPNDVHHLHETRFPVMGTEAHVRLVAPFGSAEAEPVLAAARDRLQQLELRWSRFLEDSEVSRLNATPGVPCVVSPETYNLIADAVDAWYQSGGLFDPTVGTTMVAAGYDRPRVQPSSLLDLAATGAGHHVAAPGADGIVLHPYCGAVQLPAGVQLDLGGMAKGAAADLVVSELLGGRLAAAVTGCVVNLGGDLRAGGRPPRPTGWRVALDCPGSTEARTVQLREGAVCTSTKAKRRWRSANGEQHHLRDPRTGASLETGITSVSIISARAAQAEVLTKMCFAAGPAEAARIVTGAGATGVIVVDDGTVAELPGFEAFAVTGPREQP